MSNPQGPQGPQSKPPPGAGRGAPGAMTMAMAAVNTRAVSGPKVLRIGVIQGDRMIEERVVRNRETVTVGASERNHFVVADLPPTFELFLLQGSDYVLNFTDEMRGRVGLSGGVQELSQLRSTGAARNAGTYWQIKLNDQSRGRVTIPGKGGNSDTTLLFQFIDPPPVQPRPQLPASVMQGFTANLDWLFTAFVMFSFMSHFGFVIFLENADWPMPPSLAMVPPDLVNFMVMPEEEPPPAPTEDTPPEEGDEPVEDAPPEPASDPSPGPSRSDDAPPSDGPSRADVEAGIATREALETVESMLLGATGSDGAIADALRDGAVTGGSEALIAAAEGTEIATGSGGEMRGRDSGGRVGGMAGDLGSLRRTGEGSGPREVTPLREDAPRGTFRRVADADDEGGTGSFDVQEVIRMINTRRAAITRCYESQLRSSPTLAGRVRISMTIQTTGSVTNVNTVENTTGSDEVASCVAGVIRGFRFNPGPTDGSVNYTFPFVFEPAS